jgi:hypothetical protein
MVRNVRNLALFAILAAIPAGLLAVQNNLCVYGDLYALIPTGTSIPLRTGEEIDSRNAVEGRAFPATVQRDIVDVSGRIAIPRGSPVTLVVQCVNQSGASGNADIFFDLDWVQVNGKTYWFDAGEVSAVPVRVSIVGPEFRVRVGSTLTFRLGRPLELRRAQ